MTQIVQHERMDIREVSGDKCVLSYPEQVPKSLQFNFSLVTCYHTLMGFGAVDNEHICVRVVLQGVHKRQAFIPIF